MWFIYPYPSGLYHWYKAITLGQPYDCIAAAAKPKDTDKNAELTTYNKIQQRANCAQHSLGCVLIVIIIDFKICGITTLCDTPRKNCADANCGPIRINLLWPSDAIWWHRSRSPSHYMNQCWFLISGIHLKAISEATILYNEFENYILKTVTPPRDQRVNSLGLSDAYTCVNKLASIGSDNGLSPGRRQAIFWTNAGVLLLIGPLGANFIEILIKILTFLFKKNAFENVVWEMASILSGPQCVKVCSCSKQMSANHRDQSGM